MKLKLHLLLIVMFGCLAGVHQAAAQGTQFYQIAGPSATSIISLLPDGTLIWTNALQGTNYTLQILSSLPSLPGGTNLVRTNWVAFLPLFATNAVQTNVLYPAGMTVIPPGSFTMGSTTNDPDLSDAPPHAVTVSVFFMDANLVSSNQWLTVYNWATNHGYGFVNAGASKGPGHPVQTVDWYDTLKWCNARSQQAGLAPVYFTDAGFTQVYTNGEVGVYANWAAKGYRLPTEAEWEKAARGGSVGQDFPWGNTISWDQANYVADPGLLDSNGYSYDLAFAIGSNTNWYTGAVPFTSPVGTLQPNGYGLTDMVGNLYEWCWDFYSLTYYSVSPATDPHGPLYTDYPDHTVRGGSWSNGAPYCRTARRTYWNQSLANSEIGFRCVLPQ